jgi:hypothetical protein
LRKYRKRGPAETPAFSFFGQVCDAARLARSGDVAAEDAEFAGGVADFREGLIELGHIAGFDIDEKLILPGTTVDGTAFDFEQVDAVSGEGFEGCEKRAGAVGETHSERDLARVGRNPRRGFFFRKQEDEAREVLGVVLDGFGENHPSIVDGSTASGNRGAGFVSTREHFTDTACGVFGGHAL